MFARAVQNENKMSQYSFLYTSLTISLALLRRLDSANKWGLSYPISLEIPISHLHLCSLLPVIVLESQGSNSIGMSCGTLSSCH